jgi:hypothetical protein
MVDAILSDAFVVKPFGKQKAKVLQLDIWVCCI